MTGHYFIYENRRERTWDVMQLPHTGNTPELLKQCHEHAEAKAFIKLLED